MHCIATSPPTKKSSKAYGKECDRCRNEEQEMLLKNDERIASEQRKMFKVNVVPVDFFGYFRPSSEIHIHSFVAKDNKKGHADGIKQDQITNHGFGK
ncbi:hypothetical protein V3C99_012648 [Haemonchus contortus]